MSADAPIQTDIFDLFYFGVDRGFPAPEADTRNTETDTETGTSPPGDSLMAPLFPEDSKQRRIHLRPPSPPGSTPPSIPDGTVFRLWPSLPVTPIMAYAMSVVTGQTIPSLADGQKPVQRRILFAMWDMGL